MTETTETTTSGSIGWFEVPAADTEQSRAFYGELFYFAICADPAGNAFGVFENAEQA